MDPVIEIVQPTSSTPVTGGSLDYNVTTSDNSVSSTITVTEVGGGGIGSGGLTFVGATSRGTLQLRTPFVRGKKYLVTVTAGNTVESVIVTAH